MDQYKRAKLNKILIIMAIVLVVVAIVIVVTYGVISSNSKNKKIDLTDTVVGKNYYKEITIDTENKKVKRDQIDTTLQEEFGISDDQAEIMMNSTGELINYFENSTIEIEMQNRIIHLTNPYQTKTLLVEADEITDNYNALEEIQVQEGLYILKYDSQKKTRAAYEYLGQLDEIKKVEIDEVMNINTINDESQTMYGDKSSKDNGNTKDYGASAMGLNNYKKVIDDNGNPSPVVIATIGYGATIENEYFKDRIHEDYYNFINVENPKDIHETIAQGSRILEVIKESTSNNIKIMPIVVINDEYYTTTETIINAIAYAIQKADVICYEFVHKESYMIDLLLQNAFKENVPICCVTKMATSNEDVFPANNSRTIAVSSIDKNLKPTSYSGSGEYIDFVASSTDVEEIFNTSSTVSKWSGAGYSNAHIVSLIALIKTYHKDATILEVYNIIKDFCRDLGTQGRDSTYGYGFPDFTGIKISDIDKILPEIKELIIDDEKWEKSKIASVKGTDNIRVYGWNITKTKDVPKEWKKLEVKTNSFDVKDEIKENGTFFIWVTDNAGNVAYLTKDVTKIDAVAPTIQYTIDDSKKDTEKYIMINVSAEDKESGLHQMPYSWDKQSWGIDSNNLKVTKNGTYTIYVRDALENISEQKIKIKSFPQEGKSDIDEGDIIKEIKVSSNWEGNKNKQVTITLNDNIDIERWKITESDIAPDEFEDSEEQNQNSPVETEQNNTDVINVQPNQNTQAIQPEQSQQASYSNSQGFTNVTVTVSLEANKKYYFWVKLRNKTVNSQGFIIKKVQ